MSAHSTYQPQVLPGGSCCPGHAQKPLPSWPARNPSQQTRIGTVGNVVWPQTTVPVEPTGGPLVLERRTTRSPTDHIPPHTQPTSPPPMPGSVTTPSVALAARAGPRAEESCVGDAFVSAEANAPIVINTA